MNHFTNKLSYLAVVSTLLVGFSTHCMEQPGIQEKLASLPKLELLSVAFSPDGDTVITTSEDGKARVWDAKTGILLRIEEPTGLSESITVSPDEQEVVTGDYGAAEPRK